MVLVQAGGSAQASTKVGLHREAIQPMQLELILVMEHAEAANIAAFGVGAVQGFEGCLEQLRQGAIEDLHVTGSSRNVVEEQDFIACAVPTAIGAHDYAEFAEIELKE